MTCNRKIYFLAVRVGDLIGLAYFVTVLFACHGSITKKMATAILKNSTEKRLFFHLITNHEYPVFANLALRKHHVNL